MCRSGVDDLPCNGGFPFGKEAIEIDMMEEVIQNVQWKSDIAASFKERGVKRRETKEKINCMHC